MSAAAQAYLDRPGFSNRRPPADRTDVAGWLDYIEFRDRELISGLVAQGIDLAQLPTEEKDLAGVRTFITDPPRKTGRTPIFLELHGGGLIMGGGEICRFWSFSRAMTSEMIAWTPDYRMPPLHPYPAALDDCLALYRHALEERDPADIVVGGSSAGGNLAAALLLRARAEGLPMPAALVLLTPEGDLTESGDSFTTNLGVDLIYLPSRFSVRGVSAVTGYPNRHRGRRHSGTGDGRDMNMRFVSSSFG